MKKNSNCEDTLSISRNISDRNYTTQRNQKDLELVENVPFEKEYQRKDLMVSIALQGLSRGTPSHKA